MPPRTRGGGIRVRPTLRGRGRGGTGRGLDREDSGEEPDIAMLFPPPATPQPSQDSTTLGGRITNRHTKPIR